MKTGMGVGVSFRVAIKPAHGLGLKFRFHYQII